MMSNMMANCDDIFNTRMSTHHAWLDQRGHMPSPYPSPQQRYEENPGADWNGDENEEEGVDDSFQLDEPDLVAEEEKQQQLQQQLAFPYAIATTPSDSSTTRRKYSLTKKPHHTRSSSSITDPDFHTEFLSETYHTRPSTTLSASRQHELAQYAASYREVIPRPSGRPVNLGVELPESLEGRTMAQQARRLKMEQERREKEEQEKRDRLNNILRNTPQAAPIPASRSDSPGVQFQLDQYSSSYMTPNPSSVRPSTSSTQPRVTQHNHAQSTDGPWSARDRPQSASKRSSAYHQHRTPSAWSEVSPQSPSPTWTITASAPTSSSTDQHQRHLSTPPSQHWSRPSPASVDRGPISPSPPPDAHPDYPSNGQVYIIRPPAAAATPSPRKGTRVVPMPPNPTGASNPSPTNFVPLRQRFIGSSVQRRSDSSTNEEEKQLSPENQPIHPYPPASPSTALVVHPSQHQPQSQLSSPSGRLVVTASSRQQQIDLNNPFLYQAHAVLCSLLSPETVPPHLPYIPHLPIETVLAEAGNPQAESSPSKKPKIAVAQSGPPISRLIDLQLTLDQMQSMAQQFTGLPCIVLGRKMEPKNECGIRIESIVAGPGTILPHLTPANVKNSLLEFLQQITHQHRQELWKLITNLPSLVLWYIHYDQAAEIVCRLAELGVKARVVHMDKANSSKRGDSIQDMIKPRRTFTWYSVHLSSLTKYSFPILHLLANLLQQKAPLPNFLFELTREELEEERWKESRANVLRLVQDQHTIIKTTEQQRLAAANKHSADKSPNSLGWMNPADMRAGGALVSAEKPKMHYPGSATGYSPIELNSLPRRAQKTALRKEILLILNQKAYMTAKKEGLVIEKHKADLVKLALESDVKTLELKYQNQTANMNAERKALEERIRAAALKKEQEERLFAQEHENLLVRETQAAGREQRIIETQEQIAQHFQAIENEKVGVLSELDLIEEELAQLSLERRAIMDKEIDLGQDREKLAEELLKQRQQQEGIHKLESLALAEKARLEGEERRLQQEQVEINALKAQAAEEKAAIQREQEGIERAKADLELERAKIEELHVEKVKQLEAEAETIRQQDRAMKQSIVDEQENLQKKLAELRSVENHIHLSKNMDKEIEKLEQERREIREGRQALEGERKKIQEELELQMALKQAELKAKEAELNALEEKRLADWQRRIDEEKAARDAQNAAEERRLQEWEVKLATEERDYKEQRAFEERERAEKIAQEQVEKYKAAREAKMRGKSLMIATDVNSLLGSVNSLSSHSTSGLGAHVDASGQPLPPAPTTPSLGPIAGQGTATFESTMSVKKLVMTADDIAEMTPAQKKRYEKEQASHAEYDEIYRQFLGISFKQLKKSGPPPIYLYLELSVEKVDRVSLVLGAMPIIEIHNLRGKSSSLVTETEHANKETATFQPLLLDVAKLCALQLERPILFKITQHNRDPTVKRDYIGETQMNLLELQSHDVVPIINVEKQRKEGKKYTDSGKLHLHRAELYVQSTHGLTHHPSPNLKDPSAPVYEKLSKCLLKFDLKGVNLSMGGGFFGPSKDVAPYVEFYRKDQSTNTWSTTSCYKSEIQLGPNVTFIPIRMGFWDACYADLNRPVLCQLKHDSNLGKDEIITEFELSFGSIISTDERASQEFPAGAADKKGVRSGKLVFSNGQAYSALTDLPILCEAAGLRPAPVVKTKENMDVPPLGLESLTVENEGRIAAMKQHPQPIAFGHYQEEAPPTPSTPVTTPARPVARKSVIATSADSLGTMSVKSPGKDSTPKVHRKSPSISGTSSGGPEKGTLSQRKKVIKE